MTDLTLFKPSAAIGITPYPPVELKTIQIFDLLFIYAFDNLLDHSTPHRAFIPQLFRDLGRTTKNYEELKMHLEILQSVKVEWNILKKSKKWLWGRSVLLAGCWIDEETHEILWTYEPELAKQLYHARPYAAFSNTELVGIKSKAEHRLFQLIEDYKNSKSGTGWIRLEDFQAFMGTQYNRWNNIRAKLIEAPLEKINARKHYTVQYAIQRSGVKVVAVKFWIEAKEPPAKQRRTTSPSGNHIHRAEERRAKEQIKGQVKGQRLEDHLAQGQMMLVVPEQQQPKPAYDYTALLSELPLDVQERLLQAALDAVPEFIKHNYQEHDAAFLKVYEAERNRRILSYYQDKQRSSTGDNAEKKTP